MKKSPKLIRFLIWSLFVLFGSSLFMVGLAPMNTWRKASPRESVGQSEPRQSPERIERESEALQAGVSLKVTRDSSTFAPASRRQQANSSAISLLRREEEQVARTKTSEREIESEREEPRPDQPDEALRWRMLQLVDENGQIPHNALINAWEQTKRMPFDSSAWPVREQNQSGDISPDTAGIQPASWTWLGPGNIGGRIRSIIVHPTDSQTMWVGSVGGGIWKTTNGGTSWVALNDFMANLAVSCMAIDPTNPNVLYAGTGEGFSNLDALQGAGIFKSTDGGTTWTQLISTTSADWYYVNRIAINPSNGQIILAATQSGIWRSTDGGVSWSRKTTTPMLDINFDPMNGNRSIASGTNGAGALYSIDGGLTWSAASGLPTVGRIEVAYARLLQGQIVTHIVYANVDVNFGEVYRSTNGGQSYSRVNTGLNYFTSDPSKYPSQGWYNNIVWVDPTNPNNVVIGGIDIWRSTNSGTSFTKISDWQLAMPSQQSAHADQHVIVESSQYGSGQLANRTVFFGNDGGIYRANDVLSVSQASGWTELNNNLGITQFYGGAGNPTSGRILGGAQDNGTLRYIGGTETWDSPFGGDGGWCASDPTDPNYFYGEYVYLQIHRSTNGGQSSSYIYSGLTDANQGFLNANFIAPFILDPNNPNTLLAGGASLWRSTNAKVTVLGPSWRAIKSSIGSNISAIAVAKGNSNIIWVGHNNGAVYLTTDGMSDSPTWTRVDAPIGSPALPDRYCTRITIDPINSSRVYVTFGGFTSGNVWRTDNSGGFWTNITGNLPSAPVRTLTVWQQNTNFLYVGTEVGIFASANGGQSWSPSNDGPTNCSVDELFWMNDTLVAATHGRGMFSINIAGSQPPAVSVTSPANGATFTAPANIIITANASVMNSTISKVEFFAGSNLIGTVTSSPYTFNWSNVGAGTYALTAKATDNSGNSTVSSPVNITVNGGGGNCTPTSISVGQTLSGTLSTGDCRYPSGSNWFSDTYTFNGTAGQQIAVLMSSSTFDTWLALQDSAGTVLTFDDDGGGGTNSSIPAISGFYMLPFSGTYTIQASSSFPGETGSYSVSLIGAGGPPNNNFANAQALSGNSGSVNGTNARATNESGELNHGGNAGGASVWYQWQAPASGTVTMSTAGSSFDTLLAAYTGGSVSTLTTIASNDDEATPSILTSKITFTAIGGTTYRIAVDGYNGATGNITLTYSLAPTLTTVQFSQATYSFNESASYAAISVTRSGNISGASNVDYATSDNTATQSRDYTIATGTLSFASGETSKTFTIPLTDDVYIEGTELVSLSLSNVSGATYGTPGAATLTITDNDTVAASSNTIDGVQFFVRQHYYDFLGRLPDQGGLDYWAGQIAQCGSNATCIRDKRIDVSNAFFYEQEFQQTGAFVYRVYKVSFGTRPTYVQFMPDRTRVIGGTQLEQSKTDFANAFVQRTTFITQYPLSLTPAQYVNALNVNTGNSLTQTERDALVAGLQSGTQTRASVLRQMADNQAFINREYNASFVLTQYFGYLRRDPDQGGYDFWINVLNQYPLRDTRGQHAMVCAFITSAEYQQRFSPVVTHFNQECSP